MDSVTRALLRDFTTANELSHLDEAEQFEHFATYCIVSDRYTEDFETSDLVVGSGQDLNIDGFAIKINGRIAIDKDYVDDVLSLNGYLDAEFILIQAKTSSSFDGAALIALGDNLISQVFADKQTMPVNGEVKSFIEIKDKIYSNASKFKDNPVCRVYYVCTGTWNGDAYLTDIVERKKRELMETNLFSQVHLEPIGARQLQQLFRNTKTSISREIRFEKLVTLPAIESVQASYLGVLPHNEFLKLITDASGELIKSVFVDNVRDFQGENPVNTDIAKTITDGAFDQFVLRNNGVTIVARQIRVTSSKYTLEDYQIVNGCQTSHVLFANQASITGELYVPIKLIHTDNEEVAQSVIKSTNKQTPVEEDDLLALTQFQRDLEDYYSGTPEEYRLFYERRAKQYAAQGDKDKYKIVSIETQLKCFASMFIDSPHQAGRYQSSLLRSVSKQVFQTSHKPEPYFLSALALYRFDYFAKRVNAGDRAVRAFRYYLLLIFRYRYESSDFPGAANKKVPKYCNDLLDRLKTDERSRLAFEECVEILKEALNNLSLPLDRDSAKTKNLVEEVKRLARGRRQNTAGH